MNSQQKTGKGLGEPLGEDLEIISRGRFQTIPLSVAVFSPIAVLWNLDLRELFNENK